MSVGTASEPAVEVSSNVSGRMTVWNHLGLAAFWFAFNLHWGALLDVMVPNQASIIDPAHRAQVVGRIIGIGAIIALITPLVVGAVSDRCASRLGRRRPFMIAGTAINLVGLAIVYAGGAHRSYWLYLAGFLVIQLGSNTALGAYTGVIPDLVPVDQRGAASGYMGVMTQTGTIIGVLAAGYLPGAGTFGPTYLLLAAALVICMAITTLSMKERPIAPPATPFNWRGFLAGIWIDPRKHPNFAWVWITRFLVMMGVYCVQELIQYYLGDMNGVKDPVSTGAMLLAGVTAIATIPALLAGYVSDRTGRRPVVYIANVAMAAAALAFIFSHDFTTTLILGLIFGIGYGAYTSVDWALGCDVLPDKDNAAKDLAVWHISMTLPQSIALPAAAWLLYSFGQTSAVVDGETVMHYTRAGYTAVFTMTAIFLFSGALLLRNVRGVR